MRREQHGIEDSWHADLGWVDGYQYAMLTSGPPLEPSDSRSATDRWRADAHGASSHSPKIACRYDTPPWLMQSSARSRIWLRNASSSAPASMVTSTGT